MKPGVGTRVKLWSITVAAGSREGVAVGPAASLAEGPRTVAVLAQGTCQAGQQGEGSLLLDKLQVGRLGRHHRQPQLPAEAPSYCLAVGACRRMRGPGRMVRAQVPRTLAAAQHPCLQQACRAAAGRGLPCQPRGRGGRPCHALRLAACPCPHLVGPHGPCPRGHHTRLRQVVHLLHACACARCGGSRGEWDLCERRTHHTQPCEA